MTATIPTFESPEDCEAFLSQFSSLSADIQNTLKCEWSILITYEYEPYEALEMALDKLSEQITQEERDNLLKVFASKLSPEALHEVSPEALHEVSQEPSQTIVFHATQDECIDFVGQFDSISKPIKTLLSKKWFKEIEKGKTPYQALNDAVNSTDKRLAEKMLKAFADTFTQEASQVSSQEALHEPSQEALHEPSQQPSQEALPVPSQEVSQEALPEPSQQPSYEVSKADTVESYVEMLCEEEDNNENAPMEDTTDVVVENASDTLREKARPDTSDKVDYFHMPKYDRDQLIKRTTENLTIEHPDPDFKRLLSAAPAMIVRRFIFMKYRTYLRSEHDMTDDNKDFFMMFNWFLSPEHNQDVKRLEKEALMKMYTTQSPEALIQKTIEYRKSHQYFLTIPKIDTLLWQTRVVRSSVFDFNDVIRMRTFDDNGWEINEAINEVITPQFIAIHPFFDFDFDFPITTLDNDKIAKIDSVFKWLDDLKAIFGNYCAGGYTKNITLAKKYFPKNYRPYTENGGHEFSLHVVFYERAMLITDLYELFRVKDKQKLYTQNMIDDIDPSVYGLTKRRVFRHLLSPKLNLMEAKKRKTPYERDDRMYNGVFINGHSAPSFKASLLCLTGNEIPVSSKDLLEFFGYDHNNPLGRQLPVKRVRAPKQSTPKVHKEKRRLEYAEKEDKTVLDSDEVFKSDVLYKERVVKVVLPIEFMEELLSYIPCLRYSQFMYQAGSDLFKAVTAFVINSPYSYEETLRLMTNWYNSIEHKNAPGEMDKLVQRDYYKEGIHRQHNNSYFHSFFYYGISQVTKLESIEKDCCQKFNIPFELFEFYKDDLKKKREEMNNKGGHASRYMKYLEKAANEIVDFHPLNGVSCNASQKTSSNDDFKDLLPDTVEKEPSNDSSIDTLYDWLPEITKYSNPIVSAKSKIDETIRFKFHTTMFKLQQQMAEDIDKANEKRNQIIAVEEEFVKRVMAINVPGKAGYQGYRYNNFHDDSEKGIWTLTLNPGKPKRERTLTCLKEHYNNSNLTSKDFIYTSLRELEELKLEQQLAPLQGVDIKDPRTIDAMRFINDIKKTFKREIDAKCYFDFLRRKLENPKKKLFKGIVCYGAAGVFKSGLVNVVGSFIPTKILSMDNVTDKFTEYLLGKSLLCVEEIPATESNAGKLAEAIKRILNPVVNIEVKHGAAFDAEVYCDMIMNCNCSSIGGLFSYRDTKDMSRRFNMLPRIEPKNWADEYEWCQDFIADHENWKNIAYVILQQDYMTKEDLRKLAGCQLQEYKRFKTVEGNKGLLTYTQVKECLKQTSKQYLKRNSKAKPITLMLRHLNDLLRDPENRYKVGRGSEKEFLIANGVVIEADNICYVIDLAKLFFIYVSFSVTEDIERLLIALKKDFPECVDSETYQQELSDFLESNALESLDEPVQNPCNTVFKHIEA